MLHALVTVLLVLPPVVGGVALFLAIGRRGVAGGSIWRGVASRMPCVRPIAGSEKRGADQFEALSPRVALRRVLRPRGWR